MGDFFGEAALLMDQVRNADVNSIGESELFVLSKNDLQSAVKAFPRLKAAIFAAIAPRQKAAAMRENE